MRTCHQCRTGMETEQMHGEVVDRCPRCRGVFIDRGELESILALVELYRSVQLEEEDIDTVPPVERRRSVVCPADGERMTERDIGGITIDLCETCGGIWLDDGEIAALKQVENHIRENLQLYVRLGE